MDTLKEAFLSSTLLQSIIAIMLLAVICYMYLARGDAPQELREIFWAVLAFYFGSKVENAKMRRM